MLFWMLTVETYCAMNDIMLTVTHGGRARKHACPCCVLDQQPKI